MIGNKDIVKRVMLLDIIIQYSLSFLVKSHIYL